MPYVEIKVVHAQSVKGLLQTLLDVGVVGVPKLAGDENLSTRHPAILDALTDFVLVTWEC